MKPLIMKPGAPGCWAVSSQEGLKLVVILSLSSGSCEMMQQHLPRPYGQHSFTKTPPLLSHWRCCHFSQEFQGFVSLKALSMFKVQHFSVSYQVRFLQRKVPFLGRGEHIPLSFQPLSALPSSLSHPCQPLWPLLHF